MGTAVAGEARTLAPQQAIDLQQCTWMIPGSTCRSSDGCMVAVREGSTRRRRLCDSAVLPQPRRRMPSKAV